MKFRIWRQRKEDKLERRIEKIETLLINLVEELGYVVSTDSLGNNDYTYYELKKLKDVKNVGSDTNQLKNDD